ncbi:MAG TPA: cupin domain-containing protein [Bryobacteraceae bacterium]|nr:cupin domain-containing protein [Bryobacteraceae bacterium]
MQLEQIFYPLTRAAFLTEYFNQRPAEATGDAGRFSFLAGSHSGKRALQLAWALEREVEAAVTAERWIGGSVGMARAEQDMLLLQAEGRGRWKVHGKAAEASETPELNMCLSAGGALYIPRGWWRSGGEQSEGAVCWSFQIQNPTGADLLLWLSEKASKFEAYQTDIPRFASPEVIAEYLTGLRRTFGGAFRGPGLLQTFTRRLNRMAQAHAEGAATNRAKLSPESVIAIATPRIPSVFRQGADTIFVFVEGREVMFPAEAAPLLQFVIDRAPFRAAAFYREFAHDFDAEELSTFLEAVCRDGVAELAITEDEQTE